MARTVEPERRKVWRPRLPDNLREATLPRDALSDDALIERASYDRLDLAASRGRLIDIEACRFAGTSWAGSELDKVTVSDAVFEECDLANVRLEHSSFARTRLQGCRLTGAIAPSINLRNVRFEGCRLELASLRFATCDRVEFVDCELAQADLGGADVSGATFRGCNVAGTDFSNAKASGAAFIDCTWEGVRGVGSLAGATVGHSHPADEQAFMVALAGAVGVRLVLPEDFPVDT